MIFDMSISDMQPDSAALEREETRRAAITRWLASGAALWSMAVGAIVLTGWTLDIAILKSVLPGLVTMKVNTAIGLILCGLALWLLRQPVSPPRARRVAHGAAFLIIVLAALTLSQDLFSLDLGIDQFLFFEDAGAVGTISPGRMAPNTAICFLGAGIALMALGSARRGHYRHWVIECAAGLVLSVGLLSLIGYVADLTVGYRWWNLTGMALHTAVSFFLLGTALGAAAFREERLAWAIGKRATAIFVCALLMMLTLIGMAYKTAEDMVETSRAVTASYESRFHTSELLSALQDVESGQRSYLITAEEDFLDRYQSGTESIVIEMARLRRLAEKSPQRQQDLATVEPLVAARLDFARRTVETYDREGLAAAAAMVRTGEGTALMEQIRQHLTAMDREESLQATMRREESQAVTNRTLLVLPVGGLFSVAMLTAILLLLNREIVSRRDAEKTSRSGERLFRATFEHAAIGFALVAPDGRWLKTNERLCEILGYTQEELSQRSIREITHPDDLDTDRGLIRRILSNKIERYRLEKRYIRKDGSIVWINVTVSLVQGTAEEPRYFIAAVDDITERKGAEDAVRESEERYRDLVENSRDLICTHDLDGVLLSTNKAASKVTGYSLEQLMKMSLADLVAPGVEEPLADYLEKMRTSGYARGVMKIRTATGETRYWSYDNTLRTEGIDKPIVRGMGRDVTDEILARKELKEKTAELEAYFTNALDLFCISDTDGTFRRLNSEWESTLGYPLDELIGKRSINFVHPDDVPATRARREQLVSHQAEGNFVNRYRHRDGSYRSIEWRSILAGNFIYSAARDITARIESERLILESEARYRAMYEANPHSMFVYDLGTLAFLAVNDAAVDHYGYSRDEFLAMTIMDIRPSEEILRLRADLAVDRTPLQHSGEWVHQLRDGRRIDVEITSHIMEYQGRRAALVVAQDITDQKRARLAVREAQERLRRAVSAGNIGLWEWDLRTNEVDFSPEWKRQIGYDADEITSDLAEWKSRLHPGDRDRMLRVGQEYIESPWPNYFEEYRLRHKDGSYRHMIAQASLDLDEAGNPIRMVGSHVDITERVQMEEQFLQSQKMEGIGRLAGGIAHDFNNLLTVIMTYSEFAGRSLGPDHPQHSSLQEILNAAKRAGALTRQLLTFSRKQTVERVPIKLSDVLRNLEPMLSRVIGEDIRLSIDPGHDLGLVRADPGQIEQVLMNLVVNARDAMPDGGEIRVSTSTLESDDARRTHLPFLQNESYTLLEVQDDGAGMDESVRERIFEPFFTTKEVGKGTGLGLSTVYTIIKQSGGEIVVASEPGNGTTFQVFLPRIEDAGTASDAVTR